MTKLTKFAVIAVLVLFAGLALSYPSQQTDLDVSPRVLWRLRGLNLGPASINNTDAQLNANRITRTLGGSATIDFAAASILCEDSAAITILGARTGDPCFVGIPTTLATTLLGRDHSYTCYVSASDAVKVRACPAGTSDNPGSVLFNVRVLSAQ
jgi:hypothetical protein